MPSDHNTPQPLRVTPQTQYEYFDDRTALRLLKAFALQTELKNLLNLMGGQLKALCGASGIQYQNEQHGINTTVNQTDRHNADYNLIYREENLGKLTIFYSRAQTEHDIATAEDLISIAFPSMRNCIALINAQAQVRIASDLAANANLTNREQKALCLTTQEVGDGLPGKARVKTDSLILVALDNFATISNRDGDEWAHILMTSVHEQIHQGLRDADSVYHVGGDLVAVLLPNTGSKQAQEVAQKIRNLIASLELFSTTSAHRPLTACIGIADSLNADSAEAVMENAKIALTCAQDQGTDRLEIFTASPAVELTEG